MTDNDLLLIAEAKEVAIEVLVHNSNGPYQGLPRTAGWGYPEPYTRDLMLSILGIAVSGNMQLLESVRTVLKTLAANQTERGHIPSLVHDKEDRGASDTTPLFLLGLGIFRLVVKEPDFLKTEADKALKWMEYQSPSDRYLVAQQPTSDWRDEQWVFGYGLFVNTVVYSYLNLFGQHDRANHMKREIEMLTLEKTSENHNQHEGLGLKYKPYYALWSYKIYNSERFDLLGNSLAILSGIASLHQANSIIFWVENFNAEMKVEGKLAIDLPPNFFPFIQPSDAEWHKRYDLFNLPGDYHNGGIWPFICALYVAALVAARQFNLAEKKLVTLTHLVRQSVTSKVKFGFNEWIKGQDGKPMGQDWQSWSASLYLYAARCVELRKTPFFDAMRRS